MCMDNVCTMVSAATSYGDMFIIYIIDSSFVHVCNRCQVLTLALPFSGMFFADKLRKILQISDACVMTCNKTFIVSNATFSYRN